MYRMNIQHRKEWPLLIRLAQESSLENKERIRFLLALREVSSRREGKGLTGEEFGVKAVNGTNLEEQARWAIGTIKRNEKRYQEYVIKNGMVDFVSFFATLGGPYGKGWATHNPVEFIRDMNYFINLIDKEI